MKRRLYFGVTALCVFIMEMYTYIRYGKTIEITDKASIVMTVLLIFIVLNIIALVVAIIITLKNSKTYKECKSNIDIPAGIDHMYKAKR